MEEGEGKLDPSLPPNYVSLAQLQDRWIRKQEELKLKRKEEEMQKERDARTGEWSDENQNQRGLANELHGQMAGLSVGDVPRGKGGKDGRKGGVTEYKVKGKEKVIGAFQDGEEKKKKKNKKKRDSRKKEKSKVRGEIKGYDGGDGSEGVEIVPANEVKVGIKEALSGESSGTDGGLKGTEEIGGVHTVEVLMRNVKKVDYRSGFKSKKEYVKKTEDERGHGKWRERRNGKYRQRYMSKENWADILKGNEAEPKGEDRAEDGVLEVCNETGGVNGKNKNDDRVELEKKGHDEVLMVQSAKSGGNRRFGNGYRRYGNDVRYIVGAKDGAGRRYTSFESSGDRRKTKPRESGMMWVKKEEKKSADAAEVGSSGIPKDRP